MQTGEVTSGFSNLLSEFKRRTRTPTDVDRIRLLFRTSHDFYLYTVEEGTPFIMMLAVYNPGHNKWTYFLMSGTPARKLVEELCEKHGFEAVTDFLNAKMQSG